MRRIDVAVHKAHNKCGSAWNSWKGVPTAYSLGSHFPWGFMGGGEATWEGSQRRWGEYHHTNDKSLEQGRDLMVRKSVSIVYCDVRAHFCKHLSMVVEYSRNALLIHSVGGMWWSLKSSPVRSAGNREGKMFPCEQVYWWDLSGSWAWGKMVKRRTCGSSSLIDPCV